MAELERSLLAHPTTLKPSVWLQYIDDIFAVWSHGEEELNVCLNDMNVAKTFTAERCHNSVTLLDTCVILKDG